jgi:CRISPR/Cas system CSM-associated protein Csm2 small subunit
MTRKPGKPRAAKRKVSPKRKNPYANSTALNTWMRKMYEDAIGRQLSAEEFSADKIKVALHTNPMASAIQHQRTHKPVAFTRSGKPLPPKT